MLRLAAMELIVPNRLLVRHLPIGDSGSIRSRRMAVIWEPALAEEAARWQEIATRLTQEHFAPLAEALDREQRYPWESVRRLVEHGLAGLFIPPAHGGEGAGPTGPAALG